LRRLDGSSVDETFQLRHLAQHRSQ
jgi:hypothetical protein